VTFCQIYDTKGYGMFIRAAALPKHFLMKIFERDAQPFIIECVKKWLQQHIFTPWKVLKVMNLARGSCNYKGIEVLRSLETGGKCYNKG
jgi:hypothetical protein